MSGAELSGAQRRTLDQLCRRLVPAAYGRPGAAQVDLAAAVEARLAEGDPHVGGQVALLLTVLDHPLTALVQSGAWRRFSRLSSLRQDEWLRGWERSRVPLRRTIFQALRRLVLSTYYALSDVQREIGCLGPLHARAPALDWEGPLPGTSNADDPIARVDDGGRSRPAGPPPVQAGRERREAPPGVTQGQELGESSRLRADIVVIGSGAGGAVTAARLSEAGFDVLILEEGGYWTAPDFTEREAEMMPRLYAEDGTRATRDLSIAILQGRSVGGSTTVNWLIMLRTPGWVLEEWAREHGSEAMGPSEMAPVFDRIEEEVHARVVPEEAHSPQNRVLIDGARRLGWRVAPARINARNCVRSGFCGLGCRYDAKQSTLLTYLPAALRRGARLQSDVRVDRIERLERGGRAPLKRVHATVLDRRSRMPRWSVTVEAPVVVLAAGAVGTPAILQRSQLAGGGVGRYLRLHPTTAVVGRYERLIYGAAGVPLSSVCDEFLRGDDGYGFWIEPPPFLPAQAAAALPGFGDSHRALMESFPHLAGLIVLVRDGARTTRSSGAVNVDQHGRPTIHYSLDARDRQWLVKGMGAAARIHFAAGATEVISLHTPPCRLRSEAEISTMSRHVTDPNRLALFSAHVNGTCRIGTDPRTSGCTPDGERHGVPGLYVADGSLLPTAPGVNPQETIMAVATVIARRIADRHTP